MITCYIESYGCQMNTYDSDLVRTIMESSGCRMVDLPEKADIILVNTCSVRKHAERRVLGRVAELKKIKLSRPGKFLGVLGCLAQRLGDELLRSAPYVDVVVGPASYGNLPETIMRLRNSGERQSILDNGRKETYEGITPVYSGKISAMVPVMRGCNEFCTYCIVPSVRGEERSRPPDEVCKEVRKALDCGVVEITLLGQNITAYKYNSVDFEGILDLVSQLEGLRRLRFITSHPRHLTPGVVEVMSSRKNICNHIHLPVQSGSDRILKMMGRRYTTADYLEKVRALRETISDVAITTDIIAAFPGESREDFEGTKALMKEVMFDDAFTYKYSPRPGTPASRLTDQIDPNEAQKRLEEIIALQRQHSAEKNLSFEGKEVEVLVEREARRGANEFFGKTTCARSVVFGGQAFRKGELVHVSITGTTGPTLLGRVVRT